MPENDVRSRDWVGRIEALAREAESLPDSNARSVVVALLKAVIEFHGAGLQRIIDIIQETGVAGQRIIEAIAADNLAASVLLLHDLHPDDFETRVKRAVEKLRLRFSPHGVDVRLLSIDEDVVRLCYESSNGRSSPGAVEAIENAIYDTAPDAADVVIDGIREPATPGFVPLSELVSGQVT